VKLDKDDIRQLYEQHANGLIAYACSFLRGFTAAEDLLHEVFTRLLQSGTDFDGSPLPYLYRSVRNACINHVRDGSRDAEWHDDWLEGPPGMADLGVVLQSALQVLPAEQREVIVLHIWGQLTLEEVAETVGISPNTAASRYRYGLTKLKAQFNAVPKG
jgi:RNA polymerase sigma-70 factor (ECF subfamily)